MSDLLAPKGSLMLMECGTPHHNGYIIFSPAWFFDYFALNEFSALNQYICILESENIHTGPWHLVRWKRYEATRYQFPLHKIRDFEDPMIVNLLIATKGNSATEKHLRPVQQQYRDQKEEPFYAEAFQRMVKNSDLSYFKKTDKGLRAFEWFVNNNPDFEYLGQIGGGVDAAEIKNVSLCQRLKNLCFKC